ncbi:MAG: MFS transporter [bacterium]|nr:MFS transporter [bacterium]MCM1375466.1 MFS transporter [Muribaculum sp.]
MNKLFRRDFTMVVVGQIISLFGNAILRFALPLYLLRETDSSSLFGAVTACSFIPMVIFSLFGGVIADRKNKRNIMVTLDFTTAAVILVFGFALGKIPLVPLMIAVLMLLYGIFGIYQPTVQASIPLIAEKEFLMQGNAVINMVSTLAGLLGPIIGGVLFGAFGIMPILCISAGCFVFSAVMEIFIHIPFEKNTDGKSVFGAVSSDLSDSFKFIKNEKPVFLSVLGILALFNLILSAMMIVGIPVIVVQILGMSDTALGITQGAMGLGGLAGGMIAGVAAEKLRLKNGYVILFICSLAAFFMGISVFEAIPKNIGYIIITAVSFGAMCASTMFSVSMMTAAQRQTPPKLLGKIMAVIIAVSSCSQPVGQAIYGVLFDVFADKPYLVMIGAAVLAVAVSLYSKKIFAVLEGE